MRRLRPLLGDASPAALVLAGAVPFVFLHPNYQPHLAFGQVDVDLSDLAILAAVCAGVWSGLRDGWAPLRAGRRVWFVAGAFLLLIGVSVGWAKAYDATYGISSHLTSAAKFAEYAFLAPAAALALRRRSDRWVFAWSVALWSTALTAIAVLQFVGVLRQFRGHHPFDREPSYLGEHNFAAFSGFALAIALSAILVVRWRGIGIVSGLAGGFGVALAAALDAVGGTWLAVVGMLLVVRGHTRIVARQVVAVLAVAAVVTAASFTLRGHAVVAFMRFLGVKPSTSATSEAVQTWSQRVLLGYIGVEIWLHHPVLGVGWQESMLPRAFDPILPGARKHFASRQPPAAFPSPQHEWGVQNGIVQTLSDLGIVGFALLVALVWVIAQTVRDVARRAPPELLGELLVAVGCLLVGFAVFTGTGLLAGESVDAQLWLAVGVVVTLSDSRTRERYARTP